MCRQFDSGSSHQINKGLGRNLKKTKVHVLAMVAAVTLIRNGEELRASGWQQWGYTVPEDGDYLVALSMSEVRQFGGYAQFDAIQVVPEPGRLVLSATVPVSAGAGALCRSRGRRGREPVQRRN